MHKVIKILGTCCAKCTQTIAVIEEVVKENNIDASIIKVDDIEEIMQYNILSTPAVVIDEEIFIKGRVPSKEEILNFLK
ncbi:MAG: thioredoxin family protein [Melioribacteraceae bacterium]